MLELRETASVGYMLYDTASCAKNNQKKKNLGPYFKEENLQK